jgi:hypothetical protein
MKKLFLILTILIIGCVYSTTNTIGDSAFDTGCYYEVQLIETTYYGIFTTYEIKAPFTKYDGMTPTFKSDAEKIMKQAKEESLANYKRCQQQ